MYKNDKFVCSEINKYMYILEIIINNGILCRVQILIITKKSCKHSKNLIFVLSKKEKKIAQNYASFYSIFFVDIDEKTVKNV